ncbi:MAG: hypothetical protein LH618_04025 [Saprospiraceae bacterium]|nr:hypothetical protein [Saprospiraceae bacterium]
MPENYPRQRKLFEELIKRSKSKRIWIDRYMQANFISKSTCYERINGKIPISFDEGMQLAAHYEVPLDLCSQRFHLMQPHWNLLSESHRTIFHFFQRLRSRIPRSLPEQ